MPLVKLHATAGIAAFAIIAAFWLSTAITELSGSIPAVVFVKSAILWGMLVLIPCLAVTGGSGFRLGRGMKLPQVAAKKRRMPLIAANGLLILLPSAIFLASRAGAGDFDTAFVVVQIVELCAGLTNLVLMGLNIRDGLAISARRKSAPKPARLLA